MDYKAIFFDLDGTLINSIYDIGDSVNNVLKSKGYPIHQVEKYYKFVGNGMKKLVERALPENAREESNIDDIYSLVKEEYDQNWNKKTCLYESIDKLLDQLVEMDVFIGILSNKPHEFTVKAGNHFFKKWDLDFTQGAVDEYPHKPDPQLALRVAREMGVKPHEVIYVGDSDVDIHTAINAGFLPVGVAWGFRGAKELWDSGAKAVIEEPLELLEILKARK